MSPRLSGLAQELLAEARRPEAPAALPSNAAHVHVHVEAPRGPIDYGPLPPRESETATGKKLEGDPKVTKPGCTVAKNLIYVHGLLHGLGEGWGGSGPLGGWGVLRDGKKDLEVAAEAAAIAHDDELSEQISGWAERLPDVHNEEEAKLLCTEIELQLPRGWKLGQRCGLTRRKVQEAMKLMEQVRAGKLTHAQALEQLRGSADGDR